MKTLEEYCTVSSGVTLGKTTFTEAISPSEIAIRMIRPQDLEGNAVLKPETIEALPFLRLDETQQSKVKPHHFLQTNDIVVVARGTVFRAGILKDIDDSMRLIVSNNMIVIRPKVTFPEFIVLFLTSEWFQINDTENLFSKMLSLTLKDIRQISLELPSEEGREQIEKMFNAHETNMLALKEMVEASQQLLEAELFAHLHHSENKESR